MFAKLMSVLSVHLVLQPEQHFLYYDQVPDSEEWRCACKLATCREVKLRRRVFGTRIDSEVDARDRYASDRLGRCANAQLDLARLDALEPSGGIYLDLDAFVLRPLDTWRHCLPSAVFGRGFVHGPDQLSTGVVLAAPHAAFLARWRESFRAYDTRSWDYGVCNGTTQLASAHPSLVHSAVEFGPLPRYTSRAAYDSHLAAAPIAHLSAFRHPWRLKDVMVHRNLERIWEIIQQSMNSSRARLARADPALGACMQKIAAACWARPGGRCGIYGA
jgi:hypothetical protein